MCPECRQYVGRKKGETVPIHQRGGTARDHPTTCGLRRNERIGAT